MLTEQSETLTASATAAPAGPLIVLTAAELRFQRWRRTTGLFAGPLLLIVLWVAPMPALSWQAHRLAAIVGLVLVWWITEAIPIAATALVGTALAVICGVARPEEAWAPYASPVMFLFIGNFLLGQAITVHRLDRRLALSILSSRAVAGRVGRIPMAIALMTVLVSSWISNTATAAMMTPLVLGVLGTVRTGAGTAGRSFAIRMLLMVGYGASIGGMVTPVGASHNLVALGSLDSISGIRIHFLAWMAVAAPIALAMTAVLLAASAWWFRSDRQALAAASVQDETLRVGAWTAGQRNALIAFATAAILWITPGVVAVLGGSESHAFEAVRERLNEGTVAILAAGLLFVLPTNWAERQFTLSWKDARHIDWGTVLLFGGGLSLGGLMFRTGLAKEFGTRLIAMSGADSLWTITAVAAIVAVLVTQLTSNTATTAMLTPIVIPIAAAAGINPVPPTLAVALSASMAFMLPISMPPNAIVYGTGLVPLVSMMKFGAVLSLLGVLVVMAGLRVLCPLFGFV